ncbi:MAG: glycosyltransferase [Streptosporangiales bacterium]|nr:glycosyltransferase [Streptosporangiales bacterium]
MKPVAFDCSQARRLAGRLAGRFARRLALAGLRTANRLRRPGPPSADTVRILLFHAYGMGGTVRTCFTYAERLADNHDVEIVTVIRQFPEPRLPVPDGVRLSVLDDRTKRCGLVGRWLERFPSVLVPHSDSSRRACTLWSDLKIFRYMRSLHGGVLITTRPGLNLIAALAAPPGVITIGQEHMHLTSHGAGVRKMIRRRYPRLDSVVTLTRADQERYEAAVPGARVCCIPNGVTPLGGPPARRDGRIVIAVGRLTTQKGFDLLIKAWREVDARHPDWRLRIFGSGPKRDELRGLIEKFGLKDKVRLMGRSTEIGDRFAESSIFALSSRREGLPLVLIEAMSKGLPPVAFSCPTGPSDVIVPGENGLLVRPGDVRALAASVCELIEDPEARHRLGKAATRVVDRYAPELVAEHWETHLDELVKRRMS